MESGPYHWALGPIGGQSEGCRWYVRQSPSKGSQQDWNIGPMVIMFGAVPFQVIEGQLIERLVCYETCRRSSSKLNRLSFVSHDQRTFPVSKLSFIALWALVYFTSENLSTFALLARCWGIHVGRKTHGDFERPTIVFRWKMHYLWLYLEHLAHDIARHATNSCQTFTRTFPEIEETYNQACTKGRPCPASRPDKASFALVTQTVLSFRHVEKIKLKFMRMIISLSRKWHTQKQNLQVIA